jgi:hypothetical protein
MISDFRFEDGAAARIAALAFHDADAALIEHSILSLITH